MPTIILVENGFWCEMKTRCLSFIHHKVAFQFLNKEFHKIFVVVVVANSQRLAGIDKVHDIIHSKSRTTKYRRQDHEWKARGKPEYVQGKSAQ